MNYWLTYGQLPTREDFILAFEERYGEDGTFEVPGPTWRSSRPSPRDKFMHTVEGTYDAAAMWHLIAHLVEDAERRGDDLDGPALSFVNNVLEAIGFAWV